MGLGKRGVRIVVVGLGFGRSFVPIYQAHPSVECVAICETNPHLLRVVGDEFSVKQRFNSYDGVLQDESYDAVHLLTPVPLHVEQTLAAFEAGKHCACAVPMATSNEDLRRIIDARNRTNRIYMMMETAVYTREFLYAKRMHDVGEFGEITFMRGTYYQDLEGDYPLYWRAQPPMHYSTHAVAPLLALLPTCAKSVRCLGAGVLRSDLKQPGGNDYPLQSALFQLQGTTAIAEVTRSWFQTARSYVEAFSVYGERSGFEWPQLEHEDPVVFRLDEERPTHRRDASASRVSVPYRPDLLPSELASFSSGGHGGSHPHLAHEFISSIVEDRASAIDATTAANWTAPGIGAHESALLGGEEVLILDYTTGTTI